MSSEIPQIKNLYTQVISACSSTTSAQSQYIYTIEVYQKNFNILINEINKLRNEIEELKKAKISTS